MVPYSQFRVCNVVPVPAVAKVEVYSTPRCPHCVQAKRLLQRKAVSYVDIDATAPETRAAMVHRSGGARSVPQVFIGGRHIGGFEALASLDRRGALDALLRDG